MQIEDRLRAACTEVPAWGHCVMLMKEAAAEIERLRKLAGAVTDGPSHAQLKRQQGPQEQ